MYFLFTVSCFSRASTLSLLSLAASTFSFWRASIRACSWQLLASSSVNWDSNLSLSLRSLSLRSAHSSFSWLFSRSSSEQAVSSDQMRLCIAFVGKQQMNSRQNSEQLISNWQQSNNLSSANQSKTDRTDYKKKNSKKKTPQCQSNLVIIMIVVILTTTTTMIEDINTQISSWLKGFESNLGDVIKKFNKHWKM